MYSEYKIFKIKGNPNNFLFIKALNAGLHAWEVVKPDHLISRLIFVKEIENGEEFLKSIGVWERFEKEYTYDVKDDIKVYQQSTPIGTKVIQEVLKEEVKQMATIKVDDKIDEQQLTKINETLQREIVKRRGRPKGSKNKPKED